MQYGPGFLDVLLYSDKLCRVVSLLVTFMNTLCIIHLLRKCAYQCEQLIQRCKIIEEGRTSAWSIWSVPTKYTFLGSKFSQYAVGFC